MTMRSLKPGRSGSVPDASASPPAQARPFARWWWHEPLDPIRDREPSGLVGPVTLRG